MPMPVMEMLGRPARITFKVRKDKIVVVRGPEEAPRRGGGRKRPARGGASRP